MKLQKIEARRVARTPPSPKGWDDFWHGFFQMTKVRSAARKEQVEKAHGQPKVITGTRFALCEEEVERQVLLNIIADIDAEEIRMFELGARRGESGVSRWRGRPQADRLQGYEGEMSRCRGRSRRIISGPESISRSRARGRAVMGRSL